MLSDLNVVELDRTISSVAAGTLLRRRGLSAETINTMVIDNPRRLLARR